MDIRDALKKANELIETVDCEGSLSFDAQGLCAIEGEGAAEVYLEIVPERDALTLYTPLFEANPSTLTSIAVRGLALNLYQVATGGGVIAFDPRSNALVLNRTVSLLDDSLDLGQCLNEHLGATRELIVYFADVVARDEASTDSTAPKHDDEEMIIIR